MIAVCIASDDPKAPIPIIREMEAFNTPAAQVRE
jgi:hypothetical protein